jgi:Family of unknown function (DUF5331)
MGDNMAFFYSFTDSIKHKWLQFYQANRDWLNLHMQVESVYTPDGGKRPPSYLILGVVNALEPKLAQLMLPFSKLNPDADTLIEVLDLHFDPDMVLGNRMMPKLEEGTADELPVVMEEKPHDAEMTLSQVNDFTEGTLSHEFSMGDMDEENHIPSGLGDISLTNGQLKNEFYQTPTIEGMDEFGDISFDDIKDTHTHNSPVSTLTVEPSEQSLEDLNTPEENAFGDVLSDVWGDEAAARQGLADNEMFLGEELSSGVFDDTEIARLFPNT